MVASETGVETKYLLESHKLFRVVRKAAIKTFSFFIEENQQTPAVSICVRPTFWLYTILLSFFRGFHWLASHNKNWKQFLRRRRRRRRRLDVSMPSTIQMLFPYFCFQGGNFVCETYIQWLAPHVNNTATVWARAAAIHKLWIQFRRKSRVCGSGF